MISAVAMRPVRLGLLTAALLALVGCESMPPQEVAKFVEVVPTPMDSAAPVRKPFVLFLQGTGGGNSRAELWMTWFHAHGVSAVIVDSARLRGRYNLDKVDSFHQSKDVSVALDFLRDRTDLDFHRFAIMGFSRGGTAALQAGSTLKPDQPRPQFVFSLYPGGAGRCPNTYTDSTRVLVFYGELDASGTRNGNRDNCRRMTEQSSNAAFHSFPDTHHAYDAMITGTEHDGGGAYLIKHNQTSVDETRRLILKEMQQKWPDVVR